MRIFGWLVMAFAMLFVGCARLPEVGTTSLQPETLGTLQRHLLEHSADIDQFRLRGPFTVAQQENIELGSFRGSAVFGDLYLSSAKESAPLVILLHGHGNAKEDHAYQAYHLATWGLHGVAVSLPNEGPWVENGKTLAALVERIRRGGLKLDPRIDLARIVLVGHSFGGAAVAVAVAEGASVAGAVLLDPASEFRELPGYLARIRKPVTILGADPHSGTTKNRADFFRYIPRDVFDISVARAHHEDAEFPFDSTLDLFDVFDDSNATRSLQITFVSALTAAAFSLGFTGKLDYVWRSAVDAVKEGKLIDRLRK